MNFDLLALVEQDGFRAIRKSASRGGQLNGPCPFCGGRDRFRVQPHHGTYGWFACNQCDRKGNAVDYLMVKRGFSKWDALIAVGCTPRDEQMLQPSLPRYAYEERPQWNEPSTQWQDAATRFYQECQRILWTPQGKEALNYLRQRGFTDATIKTAMLGYHPNETYGLTKEWRRPVKLPQGLVIPWFIDSKVWRITVRDERVPSGEGRYKQIAGGSNGLYLADALTLKRPVAVMVEGEFDALSLAQECGDLVAVVATGTTQGSHTPRWISALARQKQVLIAFDAEDKGDHAAMWWKARLENAQRLRPWWSDTNQMLQDGADLRQWLMSSGRLEADAMATTAIGETAQKHDLIDDIEPASVCSLCSAEVEFYSDEGVAFCKAHWVALTEKPITTPAQSPAGVPSAHEQRVQFRQTVKQIASLFPEGCKVSFFSSETPYAPWLVSQRVYKPRTLPPLPRLRCPAKLLMERRTQIPHTKQFYREPRLVPCKHQPLANGWCSAHQPAQTMLDLGARLDYPALSLNEHLQLEEGIANWEEHVISASALPKRLEHDIERVKAFQRRHASRTT